MNDLARFDRSIAEDGQTPVSMTLMDSFAAGAFERVQASLKQAASNLEIIAWNTSSVDTTDMANQLTDLLADLEAMKTKFEESL